MYIGEMVLLVVSAILLVGLAKGITARLHLNDYAAVFLIFVIVLLNVRGGIQAGKFRLGLGGFLSVILSIILLIRRSEKASDVGFALLSMLGCAGIAFAYTMHFLGNVGLDPRLVAPLLSLLLALWCAFSARRTFASCLFSALTGGFLGIFCYLFFLEKRGNIGGDYCFCVMWLSAIFGLTIQYLLTVMMRAVKSPRANTYFEAGEMTEEEKKKGE